MAQCDTCADVARVAVVADKFIGYRCGGCAVLLVQQFRAAGKSVHVDPLAPSKISAHVESDGSYFQSDVDCTANQKASISAPGSLPSVLPASVRCSPFRP
jgi:hypothetical protein